MDMEAKIGQEFVWFTNRFDSVWRNTKMCIQSMVFSTITTVTVSVEATETGDNPRALHLQILGPNFDELAHLVELLSLFVTK